MMAGINNNHMFRGKIMGGVWGKGSDSPGDRGRQGETDTQDVSPRTLTFSQSLQRGFGGSSPACGCWLSPGSLWREAGPGLCLGRTAAPCAHRWVWCNARSGAVPPPFWRADPSVSTSREKTNAGWERRCHSPGPAVAVRTGSLVKPSQIIEKEHEISNQRGQHDVPLRLSEGWNHSLNIWCQSGISIWQEPL